MQQLSRCTKPLGRTLMRDDMLYANFSATGFETNIICSGEVSLSLICNTEDSCRITVVIDGDEQNSFKLFVKNGENKLKLAEGLADGSHTIKVVKLTESMIAQIKFCGLEFDGEVGERPKDKPIKLEVYGDSITCGYWNETTDRDVTGMLRGDYEDGYNSYAAIAAKLLNAEYQAVSMSGWGLVMGYGPNPDALLPKVWDKTIPSTDRSVDWDFSNYVADVVVVNLSTNDTSAYTDENGLFTRKFFEDKAVWMLTQLREKYPDAYIIWANGLMGEGHFAGEIKSAIARCNDDKMSYFVMPLDNFGGEWHPTMKGHIAAGNALYEEIKRIMKI
ncbi:MAG: hypothetical protein IJF54_00845 [Clostridia bacterium]|nr:hypothetical protein [Clostridia bacterium]